MWVARRDVPSALGAHERTLQAGQAKQLLGRRPCAGALRSKCGEPPLKRTKLQLLERGEGQKKCKIGICSDSSLHETDVPSQTKRRKEKKALPGLLWHEVLLIWLMGLKARAVWKECCSFE